MPCRSLREAKSSHRQGAKDAKWRKRKTSRSCCRPRRLGGGFLCRARAWSERRGLQMAPAWRSVSRETSAGPDHLGPALHCLPPRSRCRADSENDSPKLESAPRCTVKGVIAPAGLDPRHVPTSATQIDLAGDPPTRSPGVSPSPPGARRVADHRVPECGATHTDARVASPIRSFRASRRARDGCADRAVAVGDRTRSSSPASARSYRGASDARPRKRGRWTHRGPGW